MLGKECSRAEILYKIAREDTDVEMIRKEIHFQKGSYVTDFSIKQCSEKKENEKFFSTEEFHTYFRRGLTLLTCDDGSASILRKGFQKFKEESGVIPPAVNRLFDSKALHGLKSGEKVAPIPPIGCSGVTIYRTVKEDGSNVQISWCQSVDAWAISSKNSCNLMRYAKDILLQSDLNDVQENAAKLWFAIIDAMDKELKEELKKYLSTRTLISELCGPGSLRQTVPYLEEKLIFYAVIENDGDDKCIPPFKVYRVFEKYNLEFKRAVKTPLCQSYQDMMKWYSTIQNCVEKGSFEKFGEGEVLYFTTKEESEESEKVICMVKVKTIDYKMFTTIYECIAKLSLKKPIREQLELSEKKFKNNRVFSGAKMSEESKQDYQRIYNITIKLFEEYQYKIENSFLAEALTIIRNLGKDTKTELIIKSIDTIKNKQNEALLKKD